MVRDTLRALLYGRTYADALAVMEERSPLSPRQLIQETIQAIRDRTERSHWWDAARFWVVAPLLWTYWTRRHTAAIRRHYDLPPEFYHLFLDDRYGFYSSGVYRDPHWTLEEAQAHKGQMLFDKLQVKTGGRVLEIGSGWGSFLRLLREQGVEGVGVTLSPVQHRFLEDQGFPSYLTDGMRAALHPVVGTGYNGAVSIGVMEHCKGWAVNHLRAVRETLRPGGRYVVQMIIATDERLDYGAHLFMATQVFPGDRLMTLEGFRQAVRQAGLHLQHVELFGSSYVRTLREWADRLASRWEKAVALVGERTARKFLLYIAGAAAAFDLGAMDVGQFVLVNEP